MQNQYVKARYTFVNQDGLVIPKNAMGKLIEKYYHIKFVVDGDVIDSTSVNENFIEQIDIQDLDNLTFRIFEY